MVSDIIRPASDDTDILVQARDDLRLLKSGGYEATAELVEGLIGEVGNARRLWVKAEADVVDLEAIVRDLATATSDVDVSGVQRVARAWVLDHPGTEATDEG